MAPNVLTGVVWPDKLADDFMIGNIVFQGVRDEITIN